LAEVVRDEEHQSFTMLSNSGSRSGIFTGERLHRNAILMQERQQVRRAIRMRNGERYRAIVFCGALLNIQ
jgi:hypothetical protein